MMRNFRSLFITIIYILTILRVFSFPIFSYDYPVEFPPPWLKVGTYAEYCCVAFIVNGGEKPFTFGWECTALNDMTATLNLSLIGLPAGNFSAAVDIITNTRELLAANGTVLGRTFLWLPPNLKVGDKVIADGKPPKEMVSEVDVSGGGSCRTSQGFQEIYGVIPVNLTFRHAHIIGLFDLDTGLLIEGPLLDYTTILSCFGFAEVGGYIQSFNTTNINLGPRYLYTEILTFLWDTLPISVPATVFITAVAVMVRKRRKKRSKQIKASKTNIKELS